MHLRIMLINFVSAFLGVHFFCARFDTQNGGQMHVYVRCTLCNGSIDTESSELLQSGKLPSVFSQFQDWFLIFFKVVRENMLELESVLETIL